MNEPRQAKVSITVPQKFKESDLLSAASCYIGRNAFFPLFIQLGQILGDTAEKRKYDETYDNYVRYTRMARQWGQARAFFSHVWNDTIAKKLSNTLTQLFAQVFDGFFGTLFATKAWEEMARTAQVKAWAEQAKAKIDVKLAEAQMIVNVAKAETETHWYKLQRFVNAAKAHAEAEKYKTEAHRYKLEKELIEAEMKAQSAWTQAHRMKFENQRKRKGLSSPAYSFA